VLCPTARRGGVATPRHSPRYDSSPRLGTEREERARKTKSPLARGIRSHRLWVRLRNFFAHGSPSLGRDSCRPQHRSNLGESPGRAGGLPESIQSLLPRKTRRTLYTALNIGWPFTPIEDRVILLSNMPPISDETSSDGSPKSSAM